MKVIEPFVVVEEFNANDMLRKLERAIRTCYKSEGLITADSAERIIKKMIDSGHHSTLEHEKITARIYCDRGVTHELVRHRIASYSQESTRYCNYARDRFGNELTFISPCFWPKELGIAPTRERFQWEEAMVDAERRYLKLIEFGAKPEQARSVLPNSLKTEIVTTFNLREWRHFFTLRCSPRAHPQMRQIAIPILRHFVHNGLFVLFEDLDVDLAGNAMNDIPRDRLAKVYSQFDWDALPENNLKAKG